VPLLINERIKQLRAEIAEISKGNRLYVRGPKYGKFIAAQEQRLVRLQEILDELITLTDRKKP
jgi:hypothetical protein